MENQSQNTASQFQAPPPPIQTAVPPQPTPVSQGPQADSGNGSPSAPRNLLKLLIGFLAVFLVGFILFAFVFPNINKKDEKVNLVFWGLFQDQSAYQSVIAEFEKENPGITITYEKQNVKDYREKLTTRISQGTGPDLFRFHNSWLPMLSEILLPIPTDIITKNEFEKTYYPVAERDLIKDGAIYGIPLEIDVLSLFVNTEILNKGGLVAPTNWDDFVSTSRNLTVKDAEGKIKTSGAAFGTFENITYAPDIVSLLMAQDGVNLGDLTPKPRVSDALSFYSAFAIPEGNVWDKTQDKDILAFSKGNLAMYFGYHRDFFAIKSSDPNLKFDIAPVPQLSFPAIEIASYYPLGLSIKGKYQKEALLFLKFLQKRDIQTRIYDEEAKVRGFGEPPARLDMAEKLNNTPIANFGSRAQNATSSFFAAETYDNGLNLELNTLLGSAINSILGGASPDTAAEGLSTGFPQAVGKYNAK